MASDEDKVVTNFHELFTSMAAICPNEHCLGLAQASEGLDARCGSEEAELRRICNLYRVFDTDYDNLCCTCHTEGDWGRSCRILTFKAFLQKGGRNFLLKTWQTRSIAAGHVKRSPVSGTSSTSPITVLPGSLGSPSLSSADEDEPPPLSLSLSNLSVDHADGEHGDETDSQLEVEIQTWTLRLIWRFSELSHHDVFKRCLGQVSQKELKISVPQVELKQDTKNKNTYAVYVLEVVPLKGKAWKVRKRYREIQDFYKTLKARIGHLVDLPPFPAKTLALHATNKSICAKRRKEFENFFHDLSSPETYRKIEAIVPASRLVDTFLAVDTTQFRVISRAVLNHSLMSSVKLHQAQRTMSQVVLEVLMEILFDKVKSPSQESGGGGFQGQGQGQGEGQVASTFASGQSIAHPFVLEPLFAVLTAVEPLTALLALRHLTAFFAVNPSQALHFLAHSHWQHLLAPLLRHDTSNTIDLALMLKKPDLDKSETEVLGTTSMLVLNLLVIVLHQALLANLDPSAPDCVKTASMAAHDFGALFLQTVDVLGEGLLPATARSSERPLGLGGGGSWGGGSASPRHASSAQPARSTASVAVCAPWSEGALLMVHRLLLALVKKATASVHEFKHTHTHPGWTNLYLAFNGMKALLSYPTARKKKRFGLAQQEELPYASDRASIMGGPSPGPSFVQALGSACGVSLGVGGAGGAAGAEHSVGPPERVVVLTSEVLTKLLHLIDTIALDKIDESHKFGLSEDEAQVVEFHKNKGLLYMHFFSDALNSFRELERQGADNHRMAQFFAEGGDLDVDRPFPPAAASAALGAATASTTTNTAKVTLVEPASTGPKHHPLSTRPSSLAFDVELKKLDLQERSRRQTQMAARLAALPPRSEEQEREFRALEQALAQATEALEVAARRLRKLEQEEAKCSLDEIQCEVVTSRAESHAIAGLIKHHFHEKGGPLTVYVLGGKHMVLRNRKSQELLPPDCYITVTYQKRKYITQTVKKSCEPIFNCKFVFQVEPREVDGFVRFRSYHKCDKWHKTFMGEARVSVTKMLKFAAQQKDVWLALSDLKSTRQSTRRLDMQLDLSTEDVEGGAVSGGEDDDPDKRGALNIIAQLSFDPATFETRIVDTLPAIQKARQMRLAAQQKSTLVAEQLRQVLFEADQAAAQLQALRERGAAAIAAATRPEEGVVVAAVAGDDLLDTEVVEEGAGEGADEGLVVDGDGDEDDQEDCRSSPAHSDLPPHSELPSHSDKPQHSDQPAHSEPSADCEELAPG